MKKIYSLVLTILLLSITSDCYSEDSKFEPMISYVATVEPIEIPDEKLSKLIKNARDWDKLILDNNITIGYLESKIATQNTASIKFDTLLNVYENESWSVSVKQTKWVWFAEIKSKQPKDIEIGQVLEQCFKSLKQSEKIHVETAGKTDATFIKNGEQKVEINKLNANSYKEKDWKTELRIAQSGKKYIVWTLKLDADPGPNVVGYAPALNEDWFLGYRLQQ